MSVYKSRKQSAEGVYNSLADLPSPDFSTSHPRPKSKAEAARRRAKDEILVRHGMRPSVGYGR